jgi:phosphoribosylglycinamide formyltransferase 1
MIAAIDDARPDIVCLAGYMRLLSGEFVRRYAGRMINIHPSLLPLFAGLNTHQRALDAGVRIHGCSVHFVTEGMDEGPIIAQAAVPVLAADDAATLAARVLGAEHALYPQALAMLARGSVSMGLDGRSAFAPAKAIETGAMLLSPSA